ncbi:MAG: hypothetical protein KIT43_08185 [Bauldia sp.]|nr:hypothetical protein [Bauldia sp.]MCW5716898.1 hypothetical protein [Bauldia sp.]
MIDVASHRIREYDASGALVAAGFTFFRPRYGIIKLRTVIFAAVINVGWIAVALFMLNATWPDGPFGGAVFRQLPLLPLAGIVFLLLTRKRVSFLNQKKALVFRTDGTTLFTEPTPPLDTRMVFRVAGNIDHARITSIEGRPTPSLGGGQAKEVWGHVPLHQVDLHFDDGISICAAPGVPDEESMRVIQVQLHRALLEVREAQAERPEAAQATRRRRRS